MEVLNLLKFWRQAAGDSSSGDIDVRNRASDDETEDFFDLVFSGADCELKQQQNKHTILSSNVRIISIDNDNTKSKQTSRNKSKSPKLVAGESKSNSFQYISPQLISPVKTHSKSQSQSPISLLKSPYKFRVFMFGLKDKASSSSPTSKRFSMRFTAVEGEIPTSSVIGRDNSLRSKMNREELENSSPAYEFGTKDTGIQKYLKLIRPFYVRASKIKIFDQSPTATPSSQATVNSPRKYAEEKTGGGTVAIRAAYRNLLKSRWTSSSVGVIPSSSPTSRRDDSVMQQQDGIQGAILHCKRSFSSSSSSSSAISQECNVLSRSASDSSHQKAINPSRLSVEEKRSSI